MRTTFAILVSTVLLVCGGLEAGRAAEGDVEVTRIPVGWKLVYTQDFENPESIDQFVMSDRKAWVRAPHTNQNHALELKSQSQYKPTHRSPFNIALLNQKVLGDFRLEADLMQTGKEYGHRDMCLFFGFTAPDRFYYTHIATKADKNAHNIFIVKDAPRTNIAKTTTEGVNWGLNVWHKVRLERVGDTVTVYFDDFTKPVMTAETSDFPKGFIGFGSFDDTGMIDNIKVWAPASEEKAIDFFPK